MDETTLGLILGLAGILSGLITGGLGLYYTSRARSAPLREYLFQQQIELIRRLGVVIGRIRLMPSIIRLSESPEHRQQAAADLRDELAKLEVLFTEASGIMPTEIFVEINQMIDAVIDFLEASDAGNLDKRHQEAVGGHAARTLLVFRTYLGIDSLSEKSLRLYDKAKNIETLASIDAPALGRVSARSSRTIAEGAAEPTAAGRP